MAAANSTKSPVTSRNALFNYYDIESLQNVFTLCSYMPNTGVVEVFYLVDDDGGVVANHLNEMRAATAGAYSLDYDRVNHEIAKENPAWHGITENASPEEQALLGGPGSKKVILHDLRTWKANVRLAEMFGAAKAGAINGTNRTGYGQRFRLTCDTDPSYDPINKHPYLAGYNSYNYDTTMLALYLWEALSNFDKGITDANFEPPKAERLRKYNDAIFDQHIDQMPNFLTQNELAGSDGWNNDPAKIRQNMLLSGRHLDIARLNEVQKKVALKRLLGGQGHQILESDNLGVHDSYVKTVDDLYGLFAYNVSDVVGLYKLFLHPVYASAFDLKKGLLDEYPETVYDETAKGSYQVRIDPRNVRRNRLRPDSTSAQFVGRILSPYGHLTDMKTVSFMYPSEKVAKEQGIPRVNVLETTREFFYDNVQDPKARAQFDEVYNYYKSIEGKNFNDSDEYVAAYGNSSGDIEHPALVLREMPKAALNLPYFKADGTPSSCFATFSTGGIHGAEANIALWEADSQAYISQLQMLVRARQLYADPRDLVAAAKTQHDTIVLPGSGMPVSRSSLMIGSDPTKARWRNPKKAKKNQELSTEDMRFNLLLQLAQLECETPANALALQRDPDLALTLELEDGYVIDLKLVLSKTTANSAEYRTEPKLKLPEVFELTHHADGTTSNKLKPRYTFTSCEEVIHEDFTSYYPNMLRNLSAFYNEKLGTDRYAKILDDKDRYGKMMKAPGISAEEKERLGVLRNGTKLILNSASGAGDTTFKGQPIRVNNAIISMRLLGQMFSWRIGQAQTLVGARIVSTNTDGLYSALEAELNNKVLAEQAALINVEIEPEPMVIVSKDSNNRLELIHSDDPDADPWDMTFIAAGGGSLACHKGPRPDKSLAHPAVLDWALARYLRYIAGGYAPEWRKGNPVALDQPMDQRLLMQILEEALQLEDRVAVAQLFQNIVAASSGKLTFPFASSFEDPNNPDPTKLHSPRALQHYNRVFYMRPGNPETISLQAAGAWKVTPAMKATRERTGSAPTAHCDIAKAILRKEGFAINHAERAGTKLRSLPADQDTAVRRVSGINPAWPVLIENGDLHEKSTDELNALLAGIDLNIYAELLTETYQANWYNDIPK